MWISAAVIVATLVIDGFLIVRHSGSSDEREVSESALSAAKSLLPKVLSYDYSALDDFESRAKAGTTGEFRDDYLALIDGRIRPTATADKIVTRATVPEIGIVSAQADEVVVLAFVNQVTTRDGKNSRIDGSRVRLTLTRVKGSWKIQTLTPV